MHHSKRNGYRFERFTYIKMVSTSLEVTSSFTTQKEFIQVKVIKHLLNSKINYKYYRIHDEAVESIPLRETRQ